MERKDLRSLPLEDIRNRLTKMTDRIIFRLQDRSGFPLNPPVYQPDAIVIAGRSGISLLDYATEGLEEYHAKLGRYEYPDQYPIVSTALPRPGVTRRFDGVAPYLPKVEIALRGKLLPFYTDDVLPKLCEPGDNPVKYGETAFLDAEVLGLLNERINMGRYVAISKVERDPTIWDIVPDSQILLGQLRDRKREDQVISSVLAAADRYGLKPALAEYVFRWVIEQTIGLEVKYLQGIALEQT